jgi:hypothetical protein
MALEALEQANASQDVPLREKNEGTPETAGIGATNLQGHRLLRMAGATTSEH